MLSAPRAFWVTLRRAEANPSKTPFDDPGQGPRRLSTLELIDGAGRKAALAGRGTKAGGYWAAQPLPDGTGVGLTLLLGEGVATVLSATQATNHLGIAALSNSNWVNVAKYMRERFRPRRL